MDLRTRYVVKGINKEQTIDSKINIFYDKDTGKITKVEDKWDGKLPDSSFQNVSVDQLFNPWWWVHYGEGWAWWAWSFTWNTLPQRVCAAAKSRFRGTMRITEYGLISFWQAFRKINAVTVPKMVGVPKNDEEDAARGNQ